MPTEHEPKCPSCQRPFSPGRTKCMYCGASLKNVTIPLYAYPCPVCNGMLEPQAGDGWTVHICQSCTGLWMTLGMMEQLEKLWENARIQRKIEPGKAPPKTSEQSPDPIILEKNYQYRRCPECNTIMNRKRYKLSNVVLDECWKHGSWFDAREFSKVLNYLEGGGIKRHKAARQWEARNYPTNLSSPTFEEMILAETTGPRLGFFHSFYGP